jgi:alpha-galactosidase
MLSSDMDHAVQQIRERRLTSQRHFIVAFSLAAFLYSSFGAADSNSSNPGGTLLAPTPPMGWNSYDAYGTTVTEDQVKANARWMAEHLISSGWEYVIIDMEWFVTNPTPEGNAKNSQVTLDDFGRFTPALNRFPSAAAGAGFKPLADFVHHLGLKFGIHILQGIPRQAVAKNLPIFGAGFHAADAANRAGTCKWNPDNYDLKSAPAGQAYYDSIVKLYAQWGVDFIKVDCIASRPYKGEEIRMLHAAIEKSGRPIVLSLSPGAAPFDKVDEMRRYAEMWRISDDVWDLWHSTVPYPQGLGDQFPRAAQWARFGQLGTWPDADMLPVGYLGPAPGWGKKARASRLTHDEQRTLLTLWIMFGSPLMIGSDLPHLDEWTTSQLTNQEALWVDQHAVNRRAIINTEQAAVWVAQSSGPGSYVAVFNLTNATQTLTFTWADLGLSAATHGLRDLWEKRDLERAQSLAVTLAPHASVLYGVAP